MPPEEACIDNWDTEGEIKIGKPLILAINVFRKDPPFIPCSILENYGSATHRVGISILRKTPYNIGKDIRFVTVIAVQMTDDIAGRQTDPFIQGIIEVLIPFAQDTKVFILSHNVKCSIGRSAVNNNVLNMGIILAHNTLDRLRYKSGTVQARCDN
ncbi:MAG TPA: hypothetical protein PLQ35_16805 [bacterium]|nr:hypothetical protein [bacterium]